MRLSQSEPAAPEREMLSQGLGFRIGRLARTQRRSWAQELEAFSLTPSLAAVLRGVHETPGVSVRALARTLSTDAMSAKRCADELEERGLLESGRRTDDRRPRTLTLTVAGRALVKKINQRAGARSKVLEDALSDADRQRLDKILTALEHALGIDGPDGDEITETSSHHDQPFTKRKVR